MKKIIMLFLIPAVLLLLPVAHATTPTGVSGSFNVTGATTTSTRMADGTTIVTQTLTFSITGGFKGAGSESARTVTDSTGFSTSHARFTFTGTISGRTGTATFVVVSTGQGTTVMGTFTVVSGTGDLADLHGQGTFQATGAVGTYSAQIHFDPA